jgi:hypothetical protein
MMEEGMGKNGNKKVGGNCRRRIDGWLSNPPSIFIKFILLTHCRKTVLDFFSTVEREEIS